jgi:hypothetical protein
MSNYTFRPAVRENVGLLVGTAGGTGSGKTYTAMRMASGMLDYMRAAGLTQKDRFAVLDTEARRALHYADRFKFDHCELTPPFRPQTYEEAIVAADEAGYPVIVVDSASHVWAGTGGVLDWQEEILEEKVQRALKRKDENRPEWQLRESFKMSAWIEPKMAHKHMVQRLLQVRAHLILCFRAEEKIEMKKDPKTQRLEIVPKETLSGFKGWIPVCEKNLPFELTVSFLLTAEAPGVPRPIKLQEQHRHLFPPGEPVEESTGRALAEWAAGGNSKGPGEKRTGPTDDQIIKSLTNAKTLQELDDLVDLSRGITDATNKEKARQAYATSKARLAPNAAQPKESRNAQV